MPKIKIQETEVKFLKVVIATGETTPHAIILPFKATQREVLKQLIELNTEDITHVLQSYNHETTLYELTPKTIKKYGTKVVEESKEENTNE